MIRSSRLERSATPLLRRIPWQNAPLLALGIAALGHALLLLPLPLSWHGVAGLVLLALVPGLLLADLLLPADRDPLEQAGLSLALGLSFLTMLTLGLHVLPGPLSAGLMLGAADTSALALGLLRWRRGSRIEDRGSKIEDRSRSTLYALRSTLHHPLSLLVALMLLAACLRLPNLGYSEFQGDEARAALLAAGVVTGEDDILLIHQKGPVEVLLPAAAYALLGNLSEFNARLPFAVANLAALLLVYALGRRMLGASDEAQGRLAGVLAVAALAVSGYLVAFSRLLQYQSIVLLCHVAAVWCCWRFYEEGLREREGTRDLGAVMLQPYLILAALFCAIGILAHYEGVLVAPVLLLLCLLGARRRAMTIWAQAQAALAPALLLVLIPLCFYLPFVLSPNFAITSQYVQRRIGKQGGVGFLYSNIGFYIDLSFFYSTTYQVITLATLLVAAIVVWLYMYVRPRMLAVLLAAVLLAGLVIAYVAPLLLVVKVFGTILNLGFAMVLPALLALMVARRMPIALRTLLVWFAATFLVAAFMVRKPGTHFYTSEPAWALLVGGACVQWLTPHWGRWRVWQRAALLTGAGMLLSLAAGYIAIVYIRAYPEYKRVFPAARPAIYTAPYGDKLPTGGYFGFPYRAGWKVIGYLYERGILSGTYDSNEEDLITGWYVRGAPRCDWRPQYYFVAERVQDLHWIPIDVIQQEYERIGTIMVRGDQKIAIYSRNQDRTSRYLLPPALRQSAAVPLNHLGFPELVTAEPIEESYDRVTNPNFPLGPSLGPGLFHAVPGQRLDAAFARGVRLLGYDLYAANGNGNRYLTLYWESDTALPPSYEVQVGLQDAAGTPVGSATVPCGDKSPSLWLGKTYLAVMYELPAPTATTAHIAIVDRATGATLPLLGNSSQPATGALVLPLDR